MLNLRNIAHTNVYVYWGTTDHTTNAAAWLADGTNAYIGSFTNAVTDLGHLDSALPADQAARSP